MNISEILKAKIKTFLADSRFYGKKNIYQVLETKVLVSSVKILAGATFLYKNFKSFKKCCRPMLYPQNGPLRPVWTIGR